MTQHRLHTMLLQSLLIVSALLLLVSTLAACGAAQPEITLPSATALTTPGVSPTAPATPFLSPTPWYNNLQPTKRAAFEDMDRRLAEAKTAVALTPFPTPGGPTRTPIAQPSGFSADPRHAAGAGVIIEYAPAPFPAGDFNGQNEWYAELTDQRIAVYAGGEGLGSAGGDPMQGSLAVFVRGLDKHLISGPDFYQTPIKAGPVRVVDAVGERLTLEAPDGTGFYFDVATRQWVDP